MAIMQRRGHTYRDSYNSRVESKEGESFEDYFARCKNFFDSEEKARLQFFTKRVLVDLENK